MLSYCYPIAIDALRDRIELINFLILNFNTMDIDPKKMAEELSAKASGIGGNVMDEAKDKVGDVVDKVKGQAGGITDKLKTQAAEALEKGADKLSDFADKLKG